MTFARKTPTLFVLLAVPVLALGCSQNKGGGGAEDRSSAVLAEIYECYSMHIKSNQRPPKQLSDLKGYRGINPAGIDALEKGDYIAVWGVNEKDPKTVLAYEKDAPKQGGAVLMADGTIKTMTADELQAAIKK
jgi:hypothetical protein